MTANEETAEEDRLPESRRPTLSVTISGNCDGMDASIRKAARRALRSQKTRRGRLEIAVIGDAEMRRQHHRWLGENNTTDVLTFDLRETPEQGVVDGQLLVCKSVARRRAGARGTDWRGELLLYVVHGCLHLCGYDDADEAEAARMHELEDRILGLLGWGSVFSGGGRRRAGPARGASKPRGGGR